MSPDSQRLAIPPKGLMRTALGFSYQSAINSITECNKMFDSFASITGIDSNATSLQSTN